MNNVLIELLDRLPAWSYHVFASIIAFGIFLFIIKVFSKDQKISNLIDRSLDLVNDQKLYYNQIDKLKEENRALKYEVTQFTSCINNVKEIYKTLLEAKLSSSRTENHHVTSDLLQRAIESLAYNIKSVSGDNHRVGIWSKHNEDELILIRASSGFPNDYVGQRKLELNRSIAGRCFRKGESINCPNVLADEDWVSNPQSSSQYKSLICIPLYGWGVLTIDAFQPLNDSCLIIGELYSSIINEIMLEYIHAVSRSADMFTEVEVG